MKFEKTAICTISSNNYLPYGLVCLKSAGKYNSKCDLFYLIADKYEEHFYENEININFVDVENIGIEKDELTRLQFKYNIIEFNTSIKPTFIKYLFSKGYKKVIYLDPDTQTYSSYDYVFNKLSSSDILLTPHKLYPYESKIIEDRLFLNNGIYNLGFLAVKNTANVNKFLDWWQSKLNNECYIDYKHGMATDQIWIELCPILFKKTLVLNDDGLNIAFWNINERKINKKNGNYYVNNKTKLKFIHFSSLSLYKNEELLKNVISYCKEFEEIYNEHIYEVKENMNNEIINFEYHFSKFDNGKKIPDYLRFIYGNSKEMIKMFPNPFQVGKNTYYEFCFKKHLGLNFKNSKDIYGFTRVLINIFGLNFIAKLYYYSSKSSLLLISRSLG